MAGSINTRRVYVEKENLHHSPEHFVTFDVRETDESFIVENFRHPRIKAITYDAGPLYYGLDWEFESEVRRQVINSSRTYAECLAAAGVRKLTVV